MRALIVLSLLLLPSCRTLSGKAHEGERPNVPFPTLGGKQFWRDTWWREGWRVQTNVWTGHSRLLDASGIRRAWGTEEACLLRGDELAPESPARDELVVLIHGFGRSDASLDRLARRLSERGFETACVGYPSTHGNIAKHAAGLDRLLSRLDPAPARLSFVTHSMGGIIARALNAPDVAWRARSAPGRLVQLAPPNSGAALARVVKSIPGFGLLAGPALDDMTGPLDLPTPGLEIGVIAAGSMTDSGFNLLISGDDDGVVGVEETRLDQPHEHATIRGMHTIVMNQAQAVDLVDAFLATGSFE